MRRLFAAPFIEKMSTQATVLAFTANVLAANDSDCPVNVPGFTHHGNCNLLCSPASWTDVLVFFLGNYIAHAATVVTLPGQSTAGVIVDIVLALLFPGAGVFRALRVIFTRAKLAPTDLQMAARAGALVVVAEGDGKISPSTKSRGFLWTLLLPLTKVRTRPPGSAIDEEEQHDGHGGEQREVEGALSATEPKATTSAPMTSPLPEEDEEVVLVDLVPSPGKHRKGGLRARLHTNAQALSNSADPF